MTPPSLSKTAGLILAGGRSSRFGTDKALAHFQGELMLERARRPLQHLPMIALSAKAGSTVARHAEACALLVLYDDPRGPDGPLAGVFEGLRWASALGFSSLACLPCDAPLLPLDLVSTLMRRQGAAPATFAQTLHGPHPLCALWDTSVAAALGQVLSHGEHPPVRDFLASIGAAAVWFDDADAFANANTRAGLTALEQSH